MPTPQYRNVISSTTIDPDSYFQGFKSRNPGAFGFDPCAKSKSQWCAATKLLNLESVRIILSRVSAYSISNDGDVYCRVFIPLNKPIRMDVYGDERTVSPSTAVFVPMDGWRGAYMDDTAGIYFSSTRQALAEMLRAIGAETRLEDLWRARSQNLLSGLADFRANLIETIRANICEDETLILTDQYKSNCDELLLLRLAQSLAGPPPSQRAGPTRSRHLSEAIEYIRTHYADNLRLTDVAKAAGCSLRTLQALFQAEMVRSLSGYVTLTRLNAARARLLAPEPEDSVTSIAMECGFSHLGEFAKTYNKAFSERPSETLANARIARSARRSNVLNIKTRAQLYD